MTAAAGASTLQAQAACALFLGVLAGVAHLLVVRARAGMLVRRGPAAVRSTFCLGLLGPVAATLLAASICPRAAWLLPVGLFLVQFLWLGRRPWPTEHRKGGRP